MKESIIKRGVRKLFRIFQKQLDLVRIRNQSFVIVANNCWGAEIYKHLNLPYNTPFVGLYIYPDCFIKLIKRWPAPMHSSLTFLPGNKSKYEQEPFNFPIGLLDGDIEIHFMHYHSEEEAYEKWTRRTQRMWATQDESNYFFKLCDRLNCTAEQMREFHNLPVANKISFSAYKIESPDNIQLKTKHLDQGEAPTGIELYNTAQYYFDMVQWLNTRTIKSSWLHQLYKFFVV